MNCTCANCTTLKRWDEVYYKPYLKDHPEQESEIERMRTVDKKCLVCLKEIKKQAEVDFMKIVKKVKTAKDFKSYSEYVQYLKDSGNDEALEYLSVGEGAW